MSERKTKRLSGFQYRQKKELQSEERKKLSGALEQFLVKRGEATEENVDKNVGPSTSKDVSCEGVEKEVQIIESGKGKRTSSPKLSNSDGSSGDSSNDIFPNKGQASATCNTESSNLYLVSDDPGKWPAKINPHDVQFIVENFPPQIKNINFPRDAIKSKI